MLKKFSYLSLVAITVMGISSFLFVKVANTATQGTLGATSTGNKGISVTIAQKVQITNINDIAIADWEVTDGTIEDNDNVCIYSNNGGNYTVTADSADGFNVFTLDSGGTNLTYAVAWTGATGGNFAGGTALADDVESSSFSGANTTDVTCGGGDNATLSVQILSADLAAITGTSTPFTDTLTIIISPT